MSLPPLGGSDFNFGEVERDAVRMPSRLENRTDDGPTGSWVGIIANQGSGTGAGHRLVRELMRELSTRGLHGEVAWTPDERRAMVRSASAESGCRCLVAVGGDGTVSALVNEQPVVPVTILPAGTENLAARHFRLKRNAASLARTIADGRIIRTDLGCANGQRFLLMTGFGFDGDVVTRHHQARVSRTGRMRPTHRIAYVEPILRSSFSYRFPSIAITIDDQGSTETLNGTTVFLFNLPRYALGLPFAPDAVEDDGLLDLVVFREPGPFQALYYLWRVFRRNHLADPGVFHRRVKRVRLTADATVPVQVDGDPAGFTPPASNGDRGHGDRSIGSVLGPSGGWMIEVIPGAIDVLIPRSPAELAQLTGTPDRLARNPGLG